MSTSPVSKLERRFVTTMNKLVRVLSQAISKAKTPQEATQILKLYCQSQEYKDWCKALATKISTQVNTQVNGTWRQAAAQASRGSEIYKRIQEELKKPLGGDFFLMVQENANLIATFPSNVSATLTEYIANEGLKGRRSTDILKDLTKQFPGVAKSQLRLIARTEVSKTQTALIKSRSVSLGANWYIWRTSEDERVRSSHSKMSGVLVNWSDPPSPETLAGTKSYGKYHAGEIFNCRCYPEPVVNLDYVDFPAKVYINGSLRTMSRKQFEKIA